MFYVDLETSSKMKLICVPTHCYWSIPYSPVNSVFFLTFSHICQIHIAELLIIPFSTGTAIYGFYYHRGSPHDYQSEVNFGGDELHLQIHTHALAFEGPLNLQFHIYLTLDDWGEGGQLHLWIHLQLCLSQYYLLYIFISHNYFTFQGQF